ncbi:MAG TPA: 1-deoxy-D-xylulose-5-phosphate reductoisomerase [Prolixibacteraceae bacterium]|nr:1-deoxy-D-xylulose-5-phosphate reductoisomerase [Prolixibacteraceae bacterium]
MKRLAILGSTGSIGTQALDVVEANPQLFSIKVLTAHNNVKLLIKQALKFRPKTVVVANDEHYDELSNALEIEGINVYSGALALQQVVLDDDVDMVVAAMVGYAGLLPVVNAIKARKEIALANKETLVVAGDIITRLCEENNVKLLPIDSEHSAIFQCLEGEQSKDIDKIILTCSGGPFRDFSSEQLKTVTSKQALAHPNWDMGAKITIDSATLMNKGFEVIEAKWLFNLSPDKIDVVVHPQSIVHSMVQFVDGSIKAQMGLPDMRLPIQYAMCYPGRIKNNLPRFSFSDYSKLTFHSPDTKKFRNLALAYRAIEKGGNMACIINAANEVVVKAFLQNRISFLQMPDVIEQCMEKISFISRPAIDDYIETDKETRLKADEIIKKLV